MKRDIFGNLLWIKRLIIGIFGLLSYRRFRVINTLSVDGSQNIKCLPENGVLFVSNHQTYFADATAFLHVLFSIKNNQDPNVGYLSTMLHPLLNVYFIAAKETMENGLLARILAYVGAIKIHRTWREAGHEVKREVDPNEVENIGLALKQGSIITFPQGTTAPFAPGRKGTAHIIKNYKPIVVPIVVSGFNQAFDKLGLKIVKKGVELKIRVKPALNIDYDNASVEDIMTVVMDSIEQSDKFISSDNKEKP